MEAWRQELYRNRQLELYHHGILGQRWGKRNGPPYPLGSGDHSASEKKAGWRKSLDSGGKPDYNQAKKPASDETPRIFGTGWKKTELMSAVFSRPFISEHCTRY